MGFFKAVGIIIFLVLLAGLLVYFISTNGAEKVIKEVSKGIIFKDNSTIHSNDIRIDGGFTEPQVNSIAIGRQVSKGYLEKTFCSASCARAHPSMNLDYSTYENNTLTCYCN